MPKIIVEYTEFCDWEDESFTCHLECTEEEFNNLKEKFEDEEWYNVSLFRGEKQDVDTVNKYACDDNSYMARYHGWANYSDLIKANEETLHKMQWKY